VHSALVGPANDLWILAQLDYCDSYVGLVVRTRNGEDAVRKVRALMKSGPRTAQEAHFAQPKVIDRASCPRGGASTQQAGANVAPAPRSVYLPLPRAARAQSRARKSLAKRHTGAREHGFGGGRRRAARGAGEH
jgi:hypothetical protein